jgi:hypothetical protein
MNPRHPFRSAKRVTVTLVVVLVGTGDEADPYREATVILDDNGRLLADFDPCDQTNFARSFQRP